MGIRLTPLESIRLAVERIGGQSATARLCGLTQGAVWRWVSGLSPFTAEHVLKVEAASGVSREWLRPDIYPPESGADGAGSPPALVRPGAGGATTSSKPGKAA